MKIINDKCLKELGIAFIEDYGCKQYRDCGYAGTYKIVYIDNVEQWCDNEEHLNRLKQFIKDKFL